MLVTQNDLIKVISESVNENTKEIIISSAYLKEDLFHELIPILSDKEVKVYVRWEAQDLITGASDVEIYQICKTKGWKLFRNPRLHAKFILIDNNILILGSSNYTMSGTGRFRKNIERNIKTTLGQGQFESLFEDYNLSVEINDDIFEKLSDYVLKHKETKDYIQHTNQIATFFDFSDNYDSYRFNLRDLPPFRPDDGSFNPEIEEHISFLKSNNVYSIHDLSPIEVFIKNNPISRIIFEIVEASDDGRCRWGTIERFIKNDDYLFSLAQNHISVLKEILSSSNRLFNLFCWIAFFEPEKYYVWNRETYLADPREGTCSLNLKKSSLF